jgi:PAS domain S-box-containing protein
MFYQNPLNHLEDLALSQNQNGSQHTAAAGSNLQIGYGWRQGYDAFAVGQQAAGDAVRDLEVGILTAVLVFASVRYDLKQVLQGIQKVTGEAPVLGATTAGEICNVPKKEGVVVVALASKYLKVRVGLGQGVSRDWQQAMTQAVNAPEIRPFFDPQDQDVWPELVRQGKSAFGLLFSPGNTRSADSRSFEILEELKRLSQGRLPIIGGAAADDWRLETNYVLWGSQAYPDSVLVAVFETQLQFGIAMAHGFWPTGSKATVTRARQHEVLEFDDKPAAEVYAQLLGFSRKDLEGKHLTLTSKRAAGTPDPYGQYSLNVASFFTAEQGVRFAQPVGEGTVLNIMDADENSLLAAGSESVCKAVLRGSILDPALILTFPCALRSRILEYAEEKSIAAIAQMLPATPIAGFCSFGEQGLADDGVNRHNNAVITTLVLDRELSHGARVALENAALQQKLEQRYRQIKAQQVFLQTLIDTLPSPIFYKDNSGKYLGCNHAFEKMFDISSDEIVGKNVYDISPKDIADKHAAMDQELFEHPGTQVYEWKVKAADGLEKEVIFYNATFSDADDKVAGLIGAFLDISHRKRAEEALLESERRFKDVAKSAQEWVWEVNAEGRFTYASPIVEKLLGYKPEEVLGKHFYDNFIVEERERLKERALTIFSNKQPFRDFIEISLHKDARRVFLSTSGVPMFDQTGNFLGYRGATTDITERKMTEEALRESEERFRQLFESAADILILHDYGNIIEVNQQACLALGYAREELLEMTIFDLELAFSKWYLLKQWEKNGEGVVEIKGVYRRRDGSTFPAEIRVSQFNYRGKNLRLVSVRDITERERIEQELRVSEKALHKSRESYRNLADYLLTSHEAERRRLGRELHDDLTQRLAALAMEAERLEVQGQTQSAAISPNLRAIKDKLAELSMNIHALSRRLHPVILEDLGLTDAIASECRGFAKREGIAVKTTSEGISEKICLEVGLCIYRIVQEGLRNIAKHARASEVFVSVVGRDGNIHLSIKDNGIGFDPAKIKKKGRLGLASMQERAYIIGGDFSVKSQPGQGTVIEVQAPLSGR